MFFTSSLFIERFRYGQSSRIILSVELIVLNMAPFVPRLLCFHSWLEESSQQGINSVTGSTKSALDNFKAIWALKEDCMREH